MVSRIGSLRLLLLTFLVAAAFSPVILKPTLALIKVTYYWSCTNLAYLAVCATGPYQGYLQLSPYLDSAAPSSSTVCVGYLPVGSTTIVCADVTGSGPGLGNGSGANVYPACMNDNPDQSTITSVHCHVTLYYN